MYFCWDCKLVLSLQKNTWHDFKKLNVYLKYYPSIPCLSVLPKRKSICLYKDLDINMHNSFICAISRLESTPEFIGRCMDKQIVVHTTISQCLGGLAPVPTVDTKVQGCSSPLYETL